jgi:uncharacterized phage protein (TIGR01671 family)
MIKFRAWLKDEKRWAHETEVNLEATNPTLMDSGSSNYWHLHKDGGHFGGCPHVESIELCSGIKDSKGKEIYTGDIVRHPIFGVSVIQFGEYDNGLSYDDNVSGVGWYVEDRSSMLALYSDNDYEVIGNIHENIDLIPDGFMLSEEVKE